MCLNLYGATLAFIFLIKRCHLNVRMRDLKRYSYLVTFSLLIAHFQIAPVTAARSCLFSELLSKAARGFRPPCCLTRSRVSWSSAHCSTLKKWHKNKWDHTITEAVVSDNILRSHFPCLSQQYTKENTNWYKQAHKRLVPLAALGIILEVLLLPGSFQAFQLSLQRTPMWAPLKIGKGFYSKTINEFLGVLWEKNILTFPWNP